jgi:hypothetical protein
MYTEAQETIHTMVSLFNKLRKKTKPCGTPYIKPDTNGHSITIELNNVIIHVETNVFDEPTTNKHIEFTVDLLHKSNPYQVNVVSTFHSKNCNKNLIFIEHDVELEQLNLLKQTSAILVSKLHIHNTK